MPTSLGPSAVDPTVFQKLLDITLSLSAERHLPRLYEQIIEVAQAFTQADGGTLYTVTEHEGQAALGFEVTRTASLGIRMGGASGEPITHKPIALFLEDGTANHANVSAHVYHAKVPVNIADAYLVEDFDFSGTRAFDKNLGYRTASLLTVPLNNHAGDIIGVLQLINAQDPTSGQTIPFSPEIEPIVAALASSAAITLDKQQLIQGHQDLLDAFVRVIAQAIDAKSSHTSAHCQRVPVLTELLARAACETQDGPLKDFELDHNGWYELRVAAWMHDCGKLATPDSVLDKSTKLHALHDRIEMVRARFAALITQTELDALRTGEPNTALQEQLAALRDDCAFLVRANRGGEFMRSEDQERVRAIAQRTWRDHEGAVQPLLSPEETDMLCIERGTLSPNERQRINQHIDVTIQMLESLPFPKHLRRVPEYAGGHHEKVNGTGFPRGLTGDQMSWPARMMAIADIFEALTARDRPYKAPMPLSQALSILQNMCKQGHIDPDLYKVFLEGRVWESYARDHLLAEQCDVQDASPYLQDAS